jgi:hypothetical protein
MSTETQSIARGILEALDPDGLILHLPHTDYRLRLRLAAAASRVTIPPGKRIGGTIEAEALRMHPAAGGGRFIEPVSGEPRIVAGIVLAVDEAQRRVLIDAGVPMSLIAAEDQDFDAIEPGGLINCYVRSGAAFTPLPG